jgi:hypothetical protein
MLTGMDNMYQPPSGGPQDNWLTQQFGPAGGQPPRPSSTRRSLRWSAGIALAALLAGGGAVAAAALTSSPASATAQPSGQAAALNTILSSASSAGTGASAGAGAASAASANSGSASSQGAAPPAATADAAALSASGTTATGTARTAIGRCRQAARALRAAGRTRAARLVRRACGSRLVRIRALGGLHGQFTFKTEAGSRTIAFARGVIESVDSGNVVVRSADNTTWTWDLVSSTVVREQGKKVGNSALSSGEQVFAGGPVVSGASDARLIVIRPASAKSAG